ncbi:MAG: hypothetical protein Q4D73_05505 [Actinomycetaceae bacterium]|nr:hypothetical protein [Actinomycetaceae bacterium]
MDDVLFYSSVEMEKPVTPDLKRGNQITVIALCDGSSGYFVLYKDKEQYANGPCGDFQVVTYRFAPYDVNEKPVFTFKVTGSDNFDVAFFQRNEQRG